MRIVDTVEYYLHDLDFDWAACFFVPCFDGLDSVALAHLLYDQNWILLWRVRIG